MSNPRIKVSQMSTANTVTPNDILMIIQDGVNKQANISALLANMNSEYSIRFNPAGYAVNISLGSKNDGSAVFVHGSTNKVGIGTDSPQSKLHVNGGNLQIGSSTTDGVTLQSTETIQYTAADQTAVVIKEISSLRSGTLLICDTGTNGKFSMPAGSNGQVKVIAVNTLSGGNTAIISCTGLGFNTITCSNVGESITLQYFSTISKWCVLSKVGAVTSTV